MRLAEEIFGPFSWEPAAEEIEIPTAMEDWDAEFERLTGRIFADVDREARYKEMGVEFGEQLNQTYRVPAGPSEEEHRFWEALAVSRRTGRNN